MGALGKILTRLVVGRSLRPYGRVASRRPASSGTAAPRPLSPQVRAMRDHIERLCRANDIAVGSHSRGGSASKRGRFIRIRPIKSAITYAIALHEIGHILGPWQSQPRLYKEAGAWKWALEVAIVWTPPMQKTMIRSLRSYLRWQQRRRRHVRLPEPEHAFWSLLGDRPRD